MGIDLKHSTVSVNLVLRDHEELHFLRSINEVEKAQLRVAGSEGVRARDALVAALLIEEGKLERHELVHWDKIVQRWEMQFPDEDQNWLFRDRTRGRRVKPHQSDSDRRTTRCCSALRIASRLLPAKVRNEELDEWVDEIYTAVDEKSPIIRRTASILLRSLPVVVLRSRLPARSRRGG
jgi:hypothetical protein